MKYIIAVAAWISGLSALVLCCSFYILIVPFLTFRGVSIMGSWTVRTIVRAFFVRIQVEGMEKVDRSAGHLYMANHSSFLDFFVLGGYLPPDTRGLVATEYYKVPLWGRFLKKTGLIPIDRSNPKASLASIKRAAEHLRNGTSILVLPEGTRTRDGRLLPFKKLPFKLAKLGGVDLVPVGFLGAFEIKRKTSWLLKPGKIIMRMGDPIPPGRIAEISLNELMEETRDQIARLVGEEIRNPSSG
jgi:1-acyl-sn-glycerol-3-phosphate acyltransferase